MCDRELEARRPHVVELRCLHRPPPPSLAPRAAAMAASKRRGLTGQLVTSAPSGRKASLIPLRIAAGGPMVPPSPMPLTPNSVFGEGEVVWIISTAGISPAPGRI